MNRYHFIGIGGIGMSALAHILLQKGVLVSGSDLKKSIIIDDLKQSGAIIQKELPFTEKDSVIFVYSSAIPKDHPELKWARLHRKTTLHRSRLLAELLKENI